MGDPVLERKTANLLVLAAYCRSSPALISGILEGDPEKVLGVLESARAIVEEKLKQGAIHFGGSLWGSSAYEVKVGAGVYHVQGPLLSPEEFTEALQALSSLAARRRVRNMAANALMEGGSPRAAPREIVLWRSLCRHSA